MRVDCGVDGVVGGGDEGIVEGGNEDVGGGV